MVYVWQRKSTPVFNLTNGTKTGGKPAVELTDGSDEGDWRLPTKTELSGIINERGKTVFASNPQLLKKCSQATIGQVLHPIIPLTRM